MVFPLINKALRLGITKEGDSPVDEYLFKGKLTPNKQLVVRVGLFGNAALIG